MHFIVLSLSLRIYLRCNKNDAVQKHWNHQWEKENNPKKEFTTNYKTNRKKLLWNGRTCEARECGEAKESERASGQKRRNEKEWLKSIKMAKATPKKCCSICMVYLYTYNIVHYFFMVHRICPRKTTNFDTKRHTYTTNQPPSIATNVTSSLVEFSVRPRFFLLQLHSIRTKYILLRLTFSSLALSFPHIFRAIKLYIIRYNTVCVWAQIHRHENIART